MRERFFTPHGKFGLGVYLREDKGKTAYYTVGGDFGVDFFSAHFPKTGITVSALGNTEMSTYPLFINLFDLLGATAE